MDHLVIPRMLFFSLKDGSLQEDSFLLKVWPAQAYARSCLWLKSQRIWRDFCKSSTYDSKTNIRNSLVPLKLLICYLLPFSEVFALTDPPLICSSISMLLLQPQIPGSFSCRRHSYLFCFTVNFQVMPQTSQLSHDSLPEQHAGVRQVWRESWIWWRYSGQWTVNFQKRTWGDNGFGESFWDRNKYHWPQKLFLSRNHILTGWLCRETYIYLGTLLKTIPEPAGN